MSIFYIRRRRCIHRSVHIGGGVLEYPFAFLPVFLRSFQDVE
jgi:hypothetical protein